MRPFRGYRSVPVKSRFCPWMWMKMRSESCAGFLLYGFFPLKYLRVPLHYTKLRREDIQPVIARVVVGSLEG